MIPKECKRLAEVDFPIAVVSAHSAREKSIRHGHPSTLHLWWARRPLAACRAMLLALLLPDPCDENCPADFKDKARRAIAALPGCRASSDEQLRQAILRFIGDFANWDLAANTNYLDASRALVKAAYPEDPPLVVDPFAGGGSIPLEALRIGCDAFASDLNPVACLILKVMLEDIPRHGPELAEELRKVGEDIKAKAEKELAEFYPLDPDGSRPIAYVWARTVRCESPNCGAEIPLVRSFWLCKKANRRRALRSKVMRPKGGPPHVEFEIFGPARESEVQTGTVTRAKAKCLCCGSVLPPERVRSQLSQQKGGADVVFDGRGNRTGGARLLAVVTLKPGQQGRRYRLADERDYGAVLKAHKRLNKIVDEWEKGGKKGLCPVPDEATPHKNGHRSVGAPRVYGMNTWRDLFNMRQLNTFVWLSRKLSSSSSARTISLALSRFADISNASCRWENTKHQVRNLFGRHALPMVWDYAEASAIGGQAGDFSVTSATMVKVLTNAKVNGRSGQVEQADARQSPLSDESSNIWFTDPPYWDNVAYADLSDFFLVWLKRTGMAIGDLVDPFNHSNPLSPKDQELTVTTLASEEAEPKTGTFFYEGMAAAFAEGRRVVSTDGIGSVVFAHKTTEGWESLLSGMVKGGWILTASWPLTTEMGNRMVAKDTAALAASIHLVCRPRPSDAPIGDWNDVHRELPKRVSSWMDRLQSEGIRGADLVFACIGPALEIYSRYSKVVDTADREIPLGGDPSAREPHKRGYLAYVWEVVGRCALEQVLGTAEAAARNGVAGALEEDSRLTALFLWTMQSTDEAAAKKTKKKTQEEEDAEDEGDDDEETQKKAKKKKGYSLIFDVVRRFAQPLGIQLPDWEHRIIETEKGVVRLLPVTERAEQLFGKEGAKAVADRLEESPAEALQMSLFAVEEPSNAPRIKGRGRNKSARAGMDVSDESLRARYEATTLDRVHAAMLLQASGRTNALRALLAAELDRGPDFLRLANALSALYPKTSEEKRLLDAMLLAVRR